MMLAYLAFREHGGGPPTHQAGPVVAAFGAGLFTLVVRNVLYVTEQTANRLGIFLAFVGLPVGLYLVKLVLTVGQPYVLQQIYSIYLLFYAFLFLGVVRFAPEFIERLPSVWALEEAGSEDALTLVALSLVFRACAAWWLMAFGSDFVWIAFVSIGGLAVHFLTDWVILIYLCRKA